MATKVLTLMSDERARLLTDLTRTRFSVFVSGNQRLRALRERLSVIWRMRCAQLKVDALALFLEELRLGSIAADKAKLNREVPMLSRLVAKHRPC